MNIGYYIHNRAQKEGERMLDWKCSKHLLWALILFDVIVGIVVISSQYSKIINHPEWSTPTSVLLLYAAPFVIVALLLGYLLHKAYSRI